MKPNPRRQSVPSRGWKRFGTATLRFLIGFGLLGVLLQSGWIEVEKLTGLWREYPWTLLAISLFVLDLLCNAIRLVGVLPAGGLYISLPDAMRLSLMGSFFDSCLPGGGGGDLFRIAYATRGMKGNRTKVATAIAMDRLIGMLAMFVSTSLLIPLFWGWIVSSPILLFLSLASVLSSGLGIAFVTWPLLSDRPIQLAQQFQEKGGWWLRVGAGLEAISLFRGKKLLLGKAFLLSVAAQAATTGAALALCRAIIGESTPLQLAVLIPFGFMGNSLPLTPGGIGVGETVFDRLFLLSGVHEGAEILIAWRVVALLVGLSGLTIYLRSTRHLVKLLPNGK